MDSAFQTASYFSCTVAELRAAVAAGRGNPIMVAEIERRDAIEAGDMSSATSGERLREVRLAERNEMDRRADLARGFAGLTKGAMRRTFAKAASVNGKAALALADTLDGPVPSDILALDDAALIAALEA